MDSISTIRDCNEAEGWRCLAEWTSDDAGETLYVVTLGRRGVQREGRGRSEEAAWEAAARVAGLDEWG